MAFGVLFDFVGNSNVSKITKAEDMVKQQWFVDAVNLDQPIDIFLLIGHNPIRTTDPISTWATVRNAIRSFHPQVPIQVFGGHTHIRDFEVYDDRSTGFEAGKCPPGFLRNSSVNEIQAAIARHWDGYRSAVSIPQPTLAPGNLAEYQTRPENLQLTRPLALHYLAGILTGIVVHSVITLSSPMMTNLITTGKLVSSSK